MDKHDKVNETNLGTRVDIDLSGIDPGSLKRLEMTVECRDCDYIDKVAGAGEVFDDRGLRYQLMHNGVRVLAGLYCGYWTAEIIRRLKGHHEPQEEKVFHEILKHINAGSTMIELGSFWAYYSLWFQKAIPNARLYLIEPDPNSLGVGQYNFVLNSAKGKFYQYSVGERPLASVPFRCESDIIMRDVEQVSVDSFVEREQIERIELLLCDIQGAELEMLKGAQATIKSGKLRFLVLSTHHQHHSGDPLTHEKCLQFVREHNGHVLACHDVSQSYSGDGLIVASFDERDKTIPEVSISMNRPENSLFGVN
jgi:methyltransferase, FkbM family